VQGDWRLEPGIRLRDGQLFLVARGELSKLAARGTHSNQAPR
jgi:hypothetical protein